MSRHEDELTIRLRPALEVPGDSDPNRMMEVDNAVARVPSAEEEENRLDLLQPIKSVEMLFPELEHSASMAPRERPEAVPETSPSPRDDSADAHASPRSDASSQGLYLDHLAPINSVEMLFPGSDVSTSSVAGSRAGAHPPSRAGRSSLLQPGASSALARNPNAQAFVLKPATPRTSRTTLRASAARHHRTTSTSAQCVYNSASKLKMPHYNGPLPPFSTPGKSLLTELLPELRTPFPSHPSNSIPALSPPQTPKSPPERRADVEPRAAGRPPRGRLAGSQTARSASEPRTHTAPHAALRPLNRADPRWALLRPLPTPPASMDRLNVLATPRRRGRPPLITSPSKNTQKGAAESEGQPILAHCGSQPAWHSKSPRASRSELNSRLTTTLIASTPPSTDTLRSDPSGDPSSIFPTPPTQHTVADSRPWGAPLPQPNPWGPEAVGNSAWPQSSVWNAMDKEPEMGPNHLKKMHITYDSLGKGSATLKTMVPPWLAAGPREVRWEEDGAGSQQPTDGEPGAEDVELHVAESERLLMVAVKALPLGAQIMFNKLPYKIVGWVRRAQVGRSGEESVMADAIIRTCFHHICLQQPDFTRMLRESAQEVEVEHLDQGEMTAMQQKITQEVQRIAFLESEIRDKCASLVPLLLSAEVKIKKALEFHGGLYTEITSSRCAVWHHLLPGPCQPPEASPEPVFQGTRNKAWEWVSKSRRHRQAFSIANETSISRKVAGLLERYQQHVEEQTLLQIRPVSPLAAEKSSIMLDIEGVRCEEDELEAGDDGEPYQDEQLISFCFRVMYQYVPLFQHSIRKRVEKNATMTAFNENEKELVEELMMLKETGKADRERWTVRHKGMVTLLDGMNKLLREILGVVMEMMQFRQQMLEVHYQLGGQAKQQLGAILQKQVELGSASAFAGASAKFVTSSLDEAAASAAVIKRWVDLGLVHNVPSTSTTEIDEKTPPPDIQAVEEGQQAVEEGQESADPPSTHPLDEMDDAAWSDVFFTDPLFKEDGAPAFLKSEVSAKWLAGQLCKRSALFGSVLLGQVPPQVAAVGLNQISLTRAAAMLSYLSPELGAKVWEKMDTTLVIAMIHSLERDKTASILAQLEHPSTDLSLLDREDAMIVVTNAPPGVVARSFEMLPTATSIAILNYFEEEDKWRVVNRVTEYMRSGYIAGMLELLSPEDGVRQMLALPVTHRVTVMIGQKGEAAAGLLHVGRILNLMDTSDACALFQHMDTEGAARLLQATEMKVCAAIIGHLGAQTLNIFLCMEIEAAVKVMTMMDAHQAVNILLAMQPLQTIDFLETIIRLDFDCAIIYLNIVEVETLAFLTDLGMQDASIAKVLTAFEDDHKVRLCQLCRPGKLALVLICLEPQPAAGILRELRMELIRGTLQKLAHVDTAAGARILASWEIKDMIYIVESLMRAARTQFGAYEQRAEALALQGDELEEEEILAEIEKDLELPEDVKAYLKEYHDSTLECREEWDQDCATLLMVMEETYAVQILNHVELRTANVLLRGMKNKDQIRFMSLMQTDRIASLMEAMPIKVVAVLLRSCDAPTGSYLLTTVNPVNIASVFEMLKLENASDILGAMTAEKGASVFDAMSGSQWTASKGLLEWHFHHHEHSCVQMMAALRVDQAQELMSLLLLTDRAHMLSLMTTDQATNIIQAMSPSKAVVVLQAMEYERMVQVVRTMTADWAAEVLNLFHDKVAAELLDKLDPHAATNILKVMDEANVSGVTAALQSESVMKLITALQTDPDTALQVLRELKEDCEVADYLEAMDSNLVAEVVLSMETQEAVHTLQLVSDATVGAIFSHLAPRQLSKTAELLNLLPPQKAVCGIRQCEVGVGAEVLIRMGLQECIKVMDLMTAEEVGERLVRLHPKDTALPIANFDRRHEVAKMLTMEHRTMAKSKILWERLGKSGSLARKLEHGMFKFKLMLKCLRKLHILELRMDFTIVKMSRATTAKRGDLGVLLCLFLLTFPTESQVWFSQLFARDLPSADAAIKLGYTAVTKRINFVEQHIDAVPTGDSMMERMIELVNVLSERGRYCTLLDEDGVIQAKKIIEDTLALEDLVEMSTESSLVYFWCKAAIELYEVVNMVSSTDLTLRSGEMGGGQKRPSLRSRFHDSVYKPYNAEQIPMEQLSYEVTKRRRNNRRPSILVNFTT
ncbi:hypothetical protein CYMTET_48545 [Cymbomonas tetramitiformis]|uniref:Magnesium transporter MgtE intracellular domain-containing protein n=1 Tax=Cymbomonas tetramitiformis TaxID=36881 RepID=A0AAE0EVM7_9CHLO|nr:hypothetical protein CYMTET_48545 [Cymbomonas tetramitiformis]